MSFTENMPFSSQTLGSSRPQVVNNFAILRSTISNPTVPNHIDVNKAGAGKHVFVQMPVQASNPPTLSGEGGFYTKSYNGVSIPYYQRDANTTINQPVIPMACASFILLNTVSNAIIVAGYNVNTVHRDSVGVYTVTLAFNLDYIANTTEYMIITGLNGQPASNVCSIVYTQISNSPGAGKSNQFKIFLFDPRNGNAIDNANSTRLSFTVLQ